MPRQNTVKRPTLVPPVNALTVRSLGLRAERALDNEATVTLIQTLRGALHPYLGGLAAEVDGEMTRFRAEKGHGEALRRASWVVLVAVLCMLTIRFLGNEDDIKRLVSLVRFFGADEAAAQLDFLLRKHPDRKLHVRIFWCISRLTCYGLLPALAIRFALRERLSDYGVGLGVGRAHLRTYLLLFAIVLPAVVVASFEPAFQAKYPYYRFAPGEPLWPNLLYWELLYASQFFALELFFRGFLIHGMRKSIGYLAVLFPIIPYVMIHFGKPLPEAIGSLVTGFVLGTLSLKSRSIVGGALIHVAVAVSMDVLSLWHRGLLGS